MHGVKRARQTHEAIEARKRTERSKLDNFLTLSTDVLARKSSREWSKEALDLTTRLLTLNPEFYTVWNYRRDIYTHGVFPQLSPNEINDILAGDLALTMSFLRQHPKIYWIWNHRRWCLENVPVDLSDDPQRWKKANWTRELLVVEKMLDADSRNFHAWDYRRYVVASMPVQRPDIDELVYTTRKIESNFSNFSAWHQRSKILSLMWESGTMDPQKNKNEEFEFVKQAMYVDPNDQSAWIYHRWLIGPGDDKELLEREITVIKELLLLEPDSKWCLESLIHYNRLLLKKHFTANDISTSSEQANLTDECSKMLEKLETIDPQRRRRYEDLAVTDYVQSGL